MEKGGRENDHKSRTIILTRREEILSAMQKNDVKILSSLFEDNSHLEEGSTTLHYAVLLACQYNEMFGVISEFLDQFTARDVQMNKPNKKGYTAIGLAVHQQQKGCIEHLLTHPSSRRLYLDYYPAESEFTVREIIMQTYPELKPLLPAPLLENLYATDTNTKLLAALQYGEYDMFHETLNPKDPNPWYDEPYYSRLLEIACQMKNRTHFVALLLDRGAHPNIENSITGMPVLHATARSGNFEVLEILLNWGGADVRKRDNEGRTALHWWALVSERTSDDKKCLENCFQLLMNKGFYKKDGINSPDSSGRTALYTTVENGFQERATLLLTEGADVSEFERGSRLILSDNISMLEGILDDCLESDKVQMKSVDYKLTLKYRLLMNIYPRMAKSRHLKHLLNHSVMSTFLSFKWQQLKRIFFLDLAFYIIFVFSLTAYILYVVSSNTTNDEDVANSSATLILNNRYIRCGINDVNTISRPYLRTEGKLTTYDSTQHVLWYLLIISWSLLAVREMYQIFVYRWKCLHSMQNWMKMLLIIFTFISCSGVIDSLELQLHFSAVAILLGWLELLLMSGRLPQLSEQLAMLKTVTFTVIRFMAGYAILLIGFALSFYVLFKGSLELDGTEMFANPFFSVLKTIVMFTGELEASNLSFDFLPYTSHVIFLLFVFLVTIILLNLLSGLAVGDTEAIRKTAETLSLVARAKLIYNIEEVLSELPRFMTATLKPRESTIELYPNKPDSIGFAYSQSLLRIIKKKEKKRKRSPFKRQDKWSFLAEKFSELQLRHKEFEKKLDSNLDEMKHFFLQLETSLEIVKPARSLLEC